MLSPLRRTLLAACLATATLTAFGCSENRTVGRSGSTGGGGGGGGGAAAKDASVSGDSGVNDPVDTGVNNPPVDSGVASMDSGVPPMGCGTNPNGCQLHELIGPAPACQCLNACEAGWMWDSGTRSCVPAGMGNPDAGFRPDTGPVDGGVPPTDAFNPAALAQRYAQAICQYTTRCEPAIFSFTGTTESDCIAEQVQQITGTWSAFANIISAGRLGFSQQAFDRCMAAFPTANCTSGLPDGVCDDIFRGSQAIGQPCSLSTECAAGGFCGISQLGSCATCMAEAPAGADCSAALCADGSECLEVQQGQFLCIPDTAGVGQSCGTVQTGLCRGRLQCVGMTSGTCVEPAAAGASCDVEGMNAAACNIYQNQVCNPSMPGGTTGTCTTISWVGAGQSCAADTVGCNSTARCDSMGTQQCVAWPTAGQTCFQGNCADDLYCAGTTCAPLQAAGSSCTSSAECADPNYCIAGTCAPLSYNFCP
jgi:hypothetical protein